MVAEVGDIAPRVGFGECIVDRLPGSRISRGRFPLPGEGEAFEVDDAPRHLPQRPSSQGVCVSTVAGWFASRTNRSSARGARNPRADRRHAAIVRLMIRDPMGSPARGGTGLPHDAYVPACGRGCLQRLSRWSRRRSGRRPPGWPVGGYWASRRCTEAVRPGAMILRGRRLLPGLVSARPTELQPGASSRGRRVSLVSCAPHRVGSGWVPVGFTDFKSAVPVASYREEGSTPLHSRQTSVSAVTAPGRHAPGWSAPPGAARARRPRWRRCAGRGP